MNKIFFISLFVIFSGAAFPQQIFTFDHFTAQLHDSLLTVTDNTTNDIIFEMTFSDPHDYTVDLDNDSVNEYIVIDSAALGNIPDYTIYIFNTLDEFSLADSIRSGTTEPYDMFSNEEGGEIIVTGNPDFEYFDSDDDQDSDIFLPINCWKYESGQIYLVNADIYDLYIQENEEIIDYLDSFTDSGEYDCDLSRRNISAIAAGYANYINAGELTIASQFIKKYYLCADMNEFLDNINRILNQGDTQ
jgi:hypothetical protein